MAKITLENGVIVEGTIEELTELAKAFGEETPEVEQRVDKDELKTEKRHAKVGERILITDAEPLEPQTYKTGGVLTVVKEDVFFAGDVEVEGQPSFIDYKEYEVIISEEKPEYVKVEGRDPKIGDFVKFTDGETRSYLKREYYEIVDIDACDDPQIKDDDGDTYDCCGREYDVYEKVTKDASEPKLENLGAVEARKGDFVKFHENHDRTIAGKLYEVIDDSDYYRDEKGLTRYTTTGWGGRSERDVYRKVVEQEPLKVGDYVKVIENDERNGYEGKPGDIVKITEVHEPGTSSNHYRTERIDGYAYAGSGNARKSQLVRATDEEVEKAKADAYFAKIGRKPGEFKKGDIVRIKLDQSGHYQETIVEVTLVRDSTLSVKGIKGSELRTFLADVECVELIAPVESRVDVE